MPKTPPLEILYEDNHCLAVVKPARLLTAGDDTGDVTLLDLAREYIKQKYKKPGKVFLGLVHRLDRPVSGVVLFARTSKAAARLSDQFRQGSVRKVYLAVVEGTVTKSSDELVDMLLKDPEQNVVTPVPRKMVGAQLCSLTYRRLNAANNLTLLEITPKTGRSHQIRVQLASRGMPIYGDVKYGSSHRFGGTIALHAAQLKFEHPVRREQITLTAPHPSAWPM